MATDREILNGALGALAIGAAGALLCGRTKPTRRKRQPPPRSAMERARREAERPPQAPTVKAARRLNRAAGLIALSTLLDSAVEHYRGSFHNKAMYTPLVVSALTLYVSYHGTGDRRPAVHRFRDFTYLVSAATGFVGTAFHIFNIRKRPGGFSWQNLFYGSPLGAPASIALAGLLGFYSERLRDNELKRSPKVFGLRAGRALAALAGIGMVATSAEAALLHFRGAYHDPFMYAPVVVPPIAAALLGDTALSHPRPPRRLTRWWLRLTALVGFAGAGFHIFGVSRNMGGWRNWRQNVLNGPPIPAPPSFTGLALAGLAALGLLDDHPDS
ncbi:MAG: hypothetical protein L0I62_04740 [Gammaproteobacteria bacterium]|nr:hypothetical protein [Gammaproteobacteria bacterium]